MFKKILGYSLLGIIIISFPIAMTHIHYLMCELCG